MRSNKKNILIISAPDVSHAAGVIAYDLHQGLSIKHNSQIMVYASNNKDKNVISYFTKRKLFFRKVINKLNRKFHFKVKTDNDFYFSQGWKTITAAKAKRVPNKEIWKFSFKNRKWSNLGLSKLPLYDNSVRIDDKKSLARTRNGSYVVVDFNENKYNFLDANQTTFNLNYYNSIICIFYNYVSSNLLNVLLLFSYLLYW